MSSFVSTFAGVTMIEYELTYLLLQTFCKLSKHDKNALILILTTKGPLGTGFDYCMKTYYSPEVRGYLFNADLL